MKLSRNGGYTVLEFHMFRTKVFPAQQLPLFGNELDRPSILKQAIKNAYKYSIGDKYCWRIGNILDLGNYTYYFRIGRISSALKEELSESPTGFDFIQVHKQESYSTHAILDIEHSMCAISKMSSPRIHVNTLGDKIGRILSMGASRADASCLIQFFPMSDPVEFIEYLRRAVEIKTFTISVSRENLFDADKDFQKPFEKLVELTNGSKGKLQIDGDSLENESVEKMAKKAASTGDSASAKLVLEAGTKPVTKHLNEKKLTVLVDEKEEFIDTLPSDDKVPFWNKVHRKILEVFEDIRGRLP